MIQAMMHPYMRGEPPFSKCLISLKLSDDGQLTAP
jgi:hypothetical protein